MKKAVFILVSAVMLISLLSCQNTVVSDTSIPDNVKIPDNMDPALAMKIREDYWRWLCENNPNMGYRLEAFWVEFYYGNYSGCEIIYMHEPFEQIDGFWAEEIAGYTFWWLGGQPVYVYKDSNFYSIAEAYDKGLLTKTDIYNFLHGPWPPQPKSSNDDSE